MVPSLVPTLNQAEIRDSSELGLLVVAPAGCGKTEALALRVQGLIERGQVCAPRRALVLTFAKRARDNILERLRTHVAPEHLRTLVTVSNFHGFAARLIRAHGNVIGVPADIGIPDSDWVKRVCRDDFGLTRGAPGIVDTILRTAKQEPRTDAEVLAAVTATGNAIARQIELRRQAEQRVTYDDMLRLAELILANDQVADLYRNHFAAVVVDEFQDLTMQQLRVVRRIGASRTTFAGDLAQGIYGFAGADPEQVLRHIRAEVAREIVFAESHRSSPAVLDVVNAIAPIVNGQLLTCAKPAQWPGGGVAATVRFANPAEEAVWIRRTAAGILRRAPRHRIAVVTRTTSRRSHLDGVFENDTDLRSYRWDQPFVDKQTVDALRAALQRADDQAATRAATRREYLWLLADGSSVQDPSARESLSEAVAWAADLHSDGVPFRDIASRVKAVDGATVLSASGVHLLNAHLGKGQQFDWVVVAGVEDGTVPFFNATSPAELLEEARVLAVMVSRARHGVILTHASRVGTWDKSPSRFLATLHAAHSCRGLSELLAWLNDADWTALADAVASH